MARSAHSRAVAISAGRDSASRTIRGSASRRARASAWWAAPISAPSVARASVATASIGTLASRPGRAVAVLLVALSPNNHPAAPDHRAIDALDHTRSVRRRNLNESVTLAEIDFSDVVTGNSAFAGNRAHEIPDFDAITGSDGHKKSGHGCATGRGAARMIAVRRSCPRDRRSILRGFAPLSTLAIEQV